MTAPTENDTLALPGALPIPAGARRGNARARSASGASEPRPRKENTAQAPPATTISSEGPSGGASAPGSAIQASPARPAAAPAHRAGPTPSPPHTAPAHLPARTAPNARGDTPARPPARTPAPARRATPDTARTAAPNRATYAPEAVALTREEALAAKRSKQRQRRRAFYLVLPVLGFLLFAGQNGQACDLIIEKRLRRLHIGERRSAQQERERCCCTE